MNCDPGEIFVNSKCSRCPSGKFTNSTHEGYAPFPSVCTLCPSGKYASTYGNSQCKECATGKLSNPSRTACIDCQGIWFSFLFSTFVLLVIAPLHVSKQKWMHNLLFFFLSLLYYSIFLFKKKKQRVNIPSSQKNAYPASVVNMRHEPSLQHAFSAMLAIAPTSSLALPYARPVMLVNIQ
jgi:hypothetical protein